MVVLYFLLEEVEVFPEYYLTTPPESCKTITSAWSAATQA